MCGNPIPRKRRQRWSWAVTCGRRCSDANAAELGRRARRAIRGCGAIETEGEPTRQQDGRRRNNGAMA